MRTTVNAAVIYFNNGALESFAAQSEDEVMEQITDWIIKTYSNLDQYHLEESLDYFLEDHSMEILMENVEIDYDPELTTVVGLLQLDGERVLSAAMTEDDLWRTFDAQLQERWSLYSEARTMDENLDRFEEVEDEEALTFQYIYR